MTDQRFETTSVAMERVILMTFQAPESDVDRIMSEVVKVTPLMMGKYDSNSYQTGAGIERYRPLEGAAIAAEDSVRKRPGTVEVSFELPDDRQTIDNAIEAIFQAHSYEEPVIRVQYLLSGRSKGLGDRDNPNRWWNTTGDWLKAKNATAS